MQLMKIFKNVTTTNTNTSEILLNDDEILILQNNVIQLQSDVTNIFQAVNTQKNMTDNERSELLIEITSIDESISAIETLNSSQNILRNQNTNNINSLEVVTYNHTSQITDIETDNISQLNSINSLNIQ